MREFVRIYIAYIQGRIDKKDTVIELGTTDEDICTLLREQLKVAIANKNDEHLRASMGFMQEYDCFNNGELLKIYNTLITDDWHSLNEDMAFILQQIADPSSIEPLYHASTMKIPHFAYNNSEAFARKCMYALGAIGTKEAEEKLRLLLQQEEPHIREYAREGLVYMGVMEEADEE